LPEYIQFWCANHDCDNDGEVRLCRDGTWSVHTFVETWFASQCSQFASRLQVSMTPPPDSTDPSD
jgi:hypothetical protein